MAKEESAQPQEPQTQEEQLPYPEPNEVKIGEIYLKSCMGIEGLVGWAIAILKDETFRQYLGLVKTKSSQDYCG